jgi:hypothetical protein
MFPQIKLRLNGQRFVLSEEIQAKSQQVLNMLMPADFNECFQKWQNHYNHCIQAHGDYFEGDGGNHDKVFMLLQANSWKFWIAPHTYSMKTLSC